MLCPSLAQSGDVDCVYPVILLYLQGGISVDSSRSTITISESEVTLKVLKAVTNDQGPYTITLTNSKGQAVAAVKVNVRGNCDSRYSAST